MTRVVVSGAGGRMGRLVCAAVVGEADLELGAAFDPGAVGQTVAGHIVSDEPVAQSDDVVVDFTQPDVVMENLVLWRSFGAHAVVGTSGFDAERLDALRAQWGGGPPNCLVVPNFSVGALLMMSLSELAAPHFAAVEVIELHHDRKVDAPSGTAQATAERLAAVRRSERQVESIEYVSGARGADVDSVRVHSVRLPGLVAHQEVIFGAPGETLVIRHDTTDAASFIPGVLMAIRAIASLEKPVSVGLEQILSINPQG